MILSRALPRSSLALVASICLTGVLGCKRDLGECNLDGETPEGQPIVGPAAFDIAYRATDGLPMYEGQALVQSTCGDGSFCHSPAAVGADRFGVPAGLNFDVGLACTVPLADCDAAPLPPYADRIGRLNDNQSIINSWAEGMIQEIRQGSMPPGAAGESVRNNTPWFRKADGAELPSIESSEGQDIVRNWLACAAPVIARTEMPPSAELELEPCPSADGEICIYNGPEGDLPDPTWSDIYWSIVFTRCVSCHGPANSNTDQNPNNPLPDGRIPGGASPTALAALNLTGSDTMNTTDWPQESWSAVVDALAADPGECAGQGTLVVPFDSTNSILVQKIEGTQTCGTEMPPGQLISQSLIQVVIDWVDLGAAND